MKLLPLFSIPLPTEEVDFNTYYKENDKIVTFKHEKIFHREYVNWIGKALINGCSSYYVKPVPKNVMNYDKIYSVYCFLKSGKKLNLRMPPAKKRIVTFEDIVAHNAMSDEELFDARFTRRFTSGSSNVDKIICSIVNDYFTDFDYTDTDRKIANSILDNGTKMGDIGQEYIELDDGNHRTLGAILAGEKTVYYRSI
jgi:hypothetical protein